MAEGGGFDFNRLAQQMGLGMGGGANGGDNTMLDDVGNKIAGLLAKLTGFLPNFSNPQQAGLSSLDKKEGVQDKMINQGAGSLSAKRQSPINAELSKRIVRDDTGLLKNEKETLARMDPHIEGLPVGDSRFDYANMSFASLGAFSSPSTPSSGISHDLGMNA